MTTVALLFLLIGVHSTLSASLPREVTLDQNLPVEESVPSYETDEPVFFQRLKRAPVNSYSGGASSGSYSGGAGSGTYGGGGSYNGGGSYSGGGISTGSYSGTNGNGGYYGSYTGFNPPKFPNFPAPIFFPMPYAPQPFDVNELFNMYFNAFQNFALQNRIDGEEATARQSTLASLATDTRRALQQAMCRVLQRLQVTWADSSPVCSSNQGNNNFFVSSSSGSHPGQGHISVSAPPGAHIEHFEGPGGLQGVSVSHQSFGPGGASSGISTVSHGGGGGNFGGSFSSVSSGSSSVNGHTDSFHSATTGVNNNGHVSSVTVTKP